MLKLIADLDFGGRGSRTSSEKAKYQFSVKGQTWLRSALSDFPVVSITLSFIDLRRQTGCLLLGIPRLAYSIRLPSYSVTFNRLR